MVIELDTGYPNRVTRVVGSDELDRVYGTVSEVDSPTFTWNDLGDQVVIVTVGDESCTVSMLNDETWYYLEVSDDTEPVEVKIEGEMTLVPKGVVLPRATGLEVLKKTSNFDQVLSDFSWRPQ